MHDILEGALPLQLKLMLKVKYGTQLHEFCNISVHVLIIAFSPSTCAQVFVIEQKLFTLEFIDEQFRSLNLRFFDGDKPSPLAGLVLTTPDSNLRQHGKTYTVTFICKV